MVRFVEREARLDCGMHLVGAAKLREGQGQVKIRKRKISVGLDRPADTRRPPARNCRRELGEAGGRQRAHRAPLRSAASSETSLSSATSQRTITSLNASVFLSNSATSSSLASAAATIALCATALIDENAERPLDVRDRLQLSVRGRFAETQELRDEAHGLRLSARS